MSRRPRRRRGSEAAAVEEADATAWIPAWTRSGGGGRGGQAAAVEEARRQRSRRPRRRRIDRIDDGNADLEGVDDDDSTTAATPALLSSHAWRARPPRF
uniref:Uncharacterized protein n=1 Tax=Oryza nivara TaxID=4536 RepID=A0A0E0HF41_ORYNI